MNILAIETSCDETACAVVGDGVKEICSVVASSKEFHEKTGGVVPEVAARKQVEFIVPVIKEALARLPKGKKIDAVAVTVGPGLTGSLVVGVEAAKSLALAWGVPLIPVNHLVGHIYANFVGARKNIVFPAVALLVSGGHTDLVLMHDHGKFEYIGGTLDDAAGEAFDKTARLLGLAKYLGGVTLSKKAAECSKNLAAGKLPRPMIGKGYDFSFSGLKTAVRRLIEEQRFPIDSVACEFESAVVDVLVDKTMRATKEFAVKSVLLGGGVAANTKLRNRLKLEAKKLGVSFHVPPVSLCTDNAVCIASAAFFNKQIKPIEKVNADPSLGIMDKL